MTRNWECFDWLLEDRYHLRGNLRDVLRAIRRGLLAGAGVALRAPQALGPAVLDVLVKDPATPVRAFEHDPC